MEETLDQMPVQEKLTDYAQDIEWLEERKLQLTEAVQELTEQVNPYAIKLTAELISVSNQLATAKLRYTLTKDSHDLPF